MASQYDLPYTGNQVEILLGEVTQLKNAMPEKVSDLPNDSGYITAADLPTKTSDLTNDSGFITNAPVNAEAARAQAAEALLATIASLQAEITRATGIEGTLQGLIDGIEAKIPLAASGSNQLADKSYVNASIATASATFRGTYTSLVALQAVAADENDYGYVISTDAVGNTIYNRYKYANSTWTFEYAIANPIFDSSQWAAINSAVTAELVAKLSALPDNATLTAALTAKQDVIDDLSSIRSKANSAYQKPSGGIPASDIADGVIPDIADNLTTNDATKVLSAKQGKVLNENLTQLGLNKTVSTPQADLEFSDEGGSVLVQFKNGHIKTKYFDSSSVNEDTALDFPAFKGFKNSEECPSFIDDYQKYLHTNFIRVAPGDIVRIKNVDLLDGILVNCYTYCYASQTQTPQVTSSWSKNDFVIPSNTNYIVIYGKPLTTDPLYIDGVIYGSEAFANNVYVEHKSSVKDESIFAGSTIPSGWYLSTNSEFSVNADPDDPWNGTGNSALTLKQIYDKIQDLAEEYSDYFTLEQIGWDSSYGHTPLNSLHDAEFADWMDNDRILSIPVYRCVLCSKIVSVPSGLAKGQGGNTIPTVYMQFGVHADEKPCMRAMLNLMIHLCRDWKDNHFLNYLRWNVRLVVIPVLVPYSYVDGRRTNYNGININRNYYDGGYWDSFTDEPPMNGKGSSALSEVETRLAYRCLLEYADSIAAFDWHTHGDFSSWKEVTTFNVPNYNDQGNAMNLIGIDLLKGLTVSGFVNHKLPYPLVNPDESIPTYQYIGDIESGTNLPLFSNIIRDIPSVIAATPEALYRYYNGQSGPVYNVFTDCINEEFVANAIFCSLRQIIVNNK